MLIAFSIVVLLSPVIFLIGYWMSAPRYKGPVSTHFNGKAFFNPDHRQAKGFPDVLKWILWRKQGPWPVERTFENGPKPVDKIANGVRITFVNHSTFLVQTDGFNILTDPVWSERVSPFSWAGPKRKRPPGIPLEYLPKIDMVLLSHNHWDHLDIKTLQWIDERDRPEFITTLGVGAFLKKYQFNVYDDLDWWQELATKSGLTVQAVPAHHFSGRGMFDRNATLWAGYVIRRPGGNIYFAGDSGYNKATFKEIGRISGPFAVSIIPIGAFKPEWFMSPIHCSPSEAVKIHQDLNSPQSIACHYGTFQLADDGKMDPLNELASALEAHALPAHSFITLREGYYLDLPA